MRKPFNHIDEKFRDAYYRFEDRPSPQVWENIEKQLEAEKMRESDAGWKKILLALVVLLCALLLQDVVLSWMNKESSAKVEERKEVTEQGKNDNSANTSDSRITRTLLSSSSLTDIAPANSNAASLFLLTNNSNDFSPAINLNQISNSKRHLTTTILFSSRHNSAGILYSNTLLPKPTPPGVIPDNNLPSFSNTFVPYWSVSPVLSYGHAAYRLDSDMPSNYQQNLIRQRENSDLSYSAGIYISYHIHKRFALQSGFIFSNTQIQIDPQKIYAFEIPSGEVAYQYIMSAGYTYIKPTFSATPNVGDSLLATEAQHSFKTFAIPLILKYNTVNPDRISFTPGVGIMANYNSSASLETEVSDSQNRETVTVKKLSGTRNFFWSGYADAEVQYKINRALSVTLRPSINFALTPITDNEIVETFPYTISAGLGLKYKF